MIERLARRVLLGFLLRPARRRAQDLACHQHLHGERLAVVGARLAGDAVLGEGMPEALYALLQRRLVVRRQARRRPRVERLAQLAQQKRGCGLDAAVEIDPGDERFVAVGEQGLLVAPARLLLARGSDALRAAAAPRVDWVETTAA
jgi:hypothetical protein